MRTGRRSSACAVPSLGLSLELLYGGMHQNRGWSEGASFLFASAKSVSRLKRSDGSSATFPLPCYLLSSCINKRCITLVRRLHPPPRLGVDGQAQSRVFSDPEGRNGRHVSREDLIFWHWQVVRDFGTCVPHSISISRFRNTTTRLLQYLAINRNIPNPNHIPLSFPSQHSHTKLLSTFNLQRPDVASLRDVAPSIDT